MEIVQGIIGLFQNTNISDHVPPGKSVRGWERLFYVCFKKRTVLRTLIKDLQSNINFMGVIKQVLFIAFIGWLFLRIAVLFKFL